MLVRIPHGMLSSNDSSRFLTEIWPKRLGGKPETRLIKSSIYEQVTALWAEKTAASSRVLCEIAFHLFQHHGHCQEVLTLYHYHHIDNIKQQGDEVTDCTHAAHQQFLHTSCPFWGHART